MADDKKPEVPGGGLYFVTAGLMAAVLWAWYLLERFTNLRVVREGGTAQTEPVHIAVAFIATPILLIGALVLWRRAVGIAENGVPAEAVIRSIGGEVQGYRDVSFDYEFEGRSYSKKMSVVGIVVEKLAPGQTLRIVVDRRSPDRVAVSNVQRPPAD
ncbi:MAG TPA: hypothetical protein PK280_21015 [Planctomycetota bacterium]|nr:hypothetical protein [Planctomycetota bacterium]